MANDDDFSKIPKGTCFQQDVLAVSIAHKSLYSSKPLPPGLDTPRALFFDDSKIESRQFYLRMFQMLRSDIFLLHRHELNVLSQDPGTPRIADLSLEDRLRFFSATRCELCSVLFNTRKRGVGGKIYYTKKVLDHEHVADDSGRLSKLRYVACQGQFINLFYCFLFEYHSHSIYFFYTFKVVTYPWLRISFPTKVVIVFMYTTCKDTTQFFSFEE